MRTVQRTPNTDASSIIKDKLISSNGKTTIHTYNGTPYDICLTEDGIGFTCKALPGIPYEFKVFDYIVALLIREGGKAKKGYARGKHDKNLFSIYLTVPECAIIVEEEGAERDEKKLSERHQPGTI